MGGLALGTALLPALYPCPQSQPSHWAFQVLYLLAGTAGCTKHEHSHNCPLSSPPHSGHTPGYSWQILPFQAECSVCFSHQQMFLCPLRCSTWSQFFFFFLLCVSQTSDQRFCFSFAILLTQSEKYNPLKLGNYSFWTPKRSLNINPVMQSSVVFFIPKVSIQNERLKRRNKIYKGFLGVTTSGFSSPCWLKLESLAAVTKEAQTRTCLRKFNGVHQATWVF